MIFYVAYSAEARQDLRDIYEYIAYELLVPETAARTMVALFGTIGNSNTSCRQVATQEQMDRF